jgi:hypothetical protein
MSSGRYECDLCVDRRLRRVLVAGGLLAWLGGCLLLLALPVPLPFEAMIGALWSASSWLELAALARGMGRIDRIRITPAGEVRAIAPDGGRQAVEVLPGSVVLERGAWLRLRFPDGCEAREWLSPRAAETEAWRLLQLAWRQRGGSFGRLPRS